MNLKQMRERMSNLTDSELLNQLIDGAFRFTISKSDCPTTFYVDIVLYAGMGNFIEYKSVAPSFGEAATEALRKYKNFEDPIYTG
jgi:hypothetical protein